MITSSGKQSDKELETSFVHFMQMCTLINRHRGIAEVKISLPRAQAFASFFSFKCTTVLWLGKENVILTRGPFGQSLSRITAATGNVDQSKSDSQNFDSQNYPCIFVMHCEFLSNSFLYLTHTLYHYIYFSIIRFQST